MAAWCPTLSRQALRGEPLTVYDDGSRTRSFCYVSDLVDGLYRLLLSDEAMPVNLGNPQEMTILEFAQAVVALPAAVRDRLCSPPGRAHQGRPADAPARYYPARARSWAGSPVSLDEGLSRTVAWFRERLPRTRDP